MSKSKWSNQLSGPDQDYWHKLNSAEKQWLYEFNERYYKDSRFNPKALSPEQYDLAGKGAGKRNNTRSRSIDNNAPMFNDLSPVNGERVKDIPAIHKPPHSEEFEFPKRKRGRPTDERRSRRIPDEELFK
jgi:hypothetical protein